MMMLLYHDSDNYMQLLQLSCVFVMSLEHEGDSLLSAGSSDICIQSVYHVSCFLSHNCDADNVYDMSC